MGLFDLQFEPLNDLFSSAPITLEDVKPAVLAHFKDAVLTGIPEVQMDISFSPSDGGDILVRKIDPEKALGYSVYNDPQHYYQNLSASLYEPSEEEILGAIGERSS